MQVQGRPWESSLGDLFHLINKNTIGLKKKKKQNSFGSFHYKLYNNLHPL